MINRRGPGTEPWGTPDVTGNGCEVNDFNTLRQRAGGWSQLMRVSSLYMLSCLAEQGILFVICLFWSFGKRHVIFVILLLLIASVLQSAPSWKLFLYVYIQHSSCNFNPVMSSTSTKPGAAVGQWLEKGQSINTATASSPDAWTFFIFWPQSAQFLHEVLCYPSLLILHYSEH